MSNPMINLLVKNTLSPLKTMMSNPQALLQNNPQAAQAMKLVQESGGDAKKAFFKLAGEMGIDGNELINSLK